MAYLRSHIRDRRLRIAFGLLVVLGVVVIDLVLSGNPALSIAVLLVVVIIGVLRRRSVLGRSWFSGPGTQR
jgi:hypothetical protein